MLTMINFSMDQRVTRQLFDKASGGDRQLSMEELKTLLLDKTIRKLRFVMEGFNRKQERVQTLQHRFIRRLVLNDQFSRVLAIDRFQRKISLDFCREVLQILRADKTDSTGRDPFDRLDFSKAMESFVVKEAGARLLAYEIIFMERLFDRVDQRRTGSVIVVDLVVTLMLLSNDSDKLAKVALAFDFFDTDGDGCLMNEQIMQMFLCLTKQRPLVEDNLRIMYELDFQDELCAQEGRHAYELILWHLQRTIKVEGGIVTKRELIEALEHLPAVSEALIPGVVHMRWALQPSWTEGDDPPSPVWPPRRSPMQPPSPAHPPPRDTTTLGAREATSLMKSIMEPYRDRRASFAQTTSPQLMPAPKRIHGASGGLGSRARGGTGNVGWRYFDEAAQFRATTTQQFQKSLRALGDTRLREMTMGFFSPPEVNQEEKPKEGAGGEAGTVVRLGSGRAGDIGRSTSAPQLNATAAGTGAGAVGGGGRRSSDQRGLLGRAGAKQGLDSSSLADVKRLVGELVGEMQHREAAVPTMFSDRFGAESIDRFRLYSAATAAAGRTWVDRPDPGSNIWHKCYVCLGNHRLNLGGECTCK